MFSILPWRRKRVYSFNYFFPCFYIVNHHILSHYFLTSFFSFQTHCYFIHQPCATALFIRMYVYFIHHHAQMTQTPSLLSPLLFCPTPFLPIIFSSHHNSSHCIPTLFLPVVLLVISAVFIVYSILHIYHTSSHSIILLVSFFHFFSY